MILSTIKNKLSPTQILVFGFCGIVLLGGFLLWLPISSRTGEETTLINAIFTATSATCVTGLITYDTYTHWTHFGQFIILCLIQIGGIGFMTIITMFSLFLKKNIGLYTRGVLMQSSGNTELRGVVKLTRRIIIGTFVFEAIGAALLFSSFYPKMGFKTGLYFSIFHSVSAFCNAGFDLMGKYSKFSSLTAFVGDPVVNITICSLIIIGGIGFIVWNNILEYKFDFKKYNLHTKIVLVTTFLLLVIPTILFFFFERNGAFSNLSFSNQIWASFFQATTPRTAGFNTINLNSLSDHSALLTICLMIVGGSSGSTAGGIKTTTLAVLIVGTLGALKGSADVTVFKKRISKDNISNAHAVTGIFVSCIIVATIAICAFESLPIKEVLFEVASAAGTVGLSLGITPTLCLASKLILILLMFGGRVGVLSLLIALQQKKGQSSTKRPEEKILVG